MHPLLKPSCLLAIWLASTAGYAADKTSGPTDTSTYADTSHPSSVNSLCHNHPFVTASNSNHRDQAEDKPDTDNSVTIQANQVDYQPAGEIELRGNIEISRGRYHAASDRATIDQASEQAHLQGNIKLQGPDIQLNGDTASMDMVKDKMSVTNARFLNPSSQINGEAGQISLPDAEGMASERLRAVSYGDTKPLVVNDSGKNRQKNRRVSLMVQRLDSRGPLTGSCS